MALNIRDHSQALLPSAQAARELDYPYERNANFQLLLDIVDSIEADDPESVMREIRHKIYALGLMGGYIGLEVLGRKFAENEKERIEHFTNPFEEPAEVFGNRMRRWRSFFALRALSTLDYKQQRKVIGDVRARFRTQENPNSALILYNDKGELINVITDDTPLDVLMDVLALAENYDANPNKSREKNISREQINGDRICALTFLIKHLITEDETTVRRVSKYLKLRHFKEILKSVPGALGEGRIGGKSAGMLIAYAALESETPDFDKEFAKKTKRKPNFDLKQILEVNESRFIGSKTFQTFLDHNKEQCGGCTTIKGKYEADEIDLEARQAEYEMYRKRILAAEFPAYLVRQLQKLFSEIHPKPCIVRSSSELEDRFGAAFAGKYESVYLANCGNFEVDFQKFITAMKQIYTSTFSPDVMMYRKEKNLLLPDEEMGLLVQTLNGENYGDGIFCPFASGVAMSRATQLVSPRANPKRGAMKLALGLGEMAVEGTSQMVTPGAPSVIDKAIEDTRMTQQEVVAVDKKTNTVKRIGVNEFLVRVNLNEADSVLRNAFAIRENGHLNTLKMFDDYNEHDNLAISYMKLLENENINFTLIIEYIIQKLKYCLGHNVDVEFTVRLDKRGKPKIKIVQCRPQNIPADLKPSKKPEEVPQERILLHTENSISCARRKNIQYMIYIDVNCNKGTANDKLNTQQVADIQKYIAILNQKLGKGNYILVSPGRLGGNVENGIPAKFESYSNAAGFVEIMGEGYRMDPSFGTHEFQNIIEAAMANMAVIPGENGEIFAQEFLETANSETSTLAPEIPPEFARWIRVIDANKAWHAKTAQSSTKGWVLHAAQDNVTRKGTIYIAEKGKDLPIITEEEEIAA